MKDHTEAEMAIIAIDTEHALRVLNAELLAALKAMVARIEHYTKMDEFARPNIEQWEYTEGSTDMAQARAAIKKATS